MNSPYKPIHTRRQLLSRSALGVGGLALASLIDTEQLAAGESAGRDANPLTPRPPHFAPRAKHVIQFFLNGGPSHVDTFDPKPALARYAGQSVAPELITERKTGAAFPSPFTFRRYGESGIEVSDLFARTAEHIDDIAVLRAMYAQVPNHEPSLMLMNCGDSVQARPSMGSWLLYGLGSESQNLPGFVAMCPGGLPIKDNENWQSAFLPGTYQGTYIDSKKTELEQLIENIRHPHISAEAQRHQLDLLSHWNSEHRSNRPFDDRLDARMQSYELAFRMQYDAADAFDISQEPEYIHRLYGSEVHGRQTLMARRLIERGVRFVQLWHGASQPWDNHDNIEVNHRKLARELDQPIAALLTDLKQRGLLDETLILWGGEFGRTPTVELAGSKPKQGRDHNHYGFSVWLAGGGIKGGTVYGATDEFGFKAQENRTSVHDLHATMLHLLGLDHERLTYRYGGRDFRLTDVHGHVIQDIIA